MPFRKFTGLNLLIGWQKQLGIALLYLLVGYVIHHSFTANGIGSIIWPGSGLALAALLIGGGRYIWGVFLGALMVNTLFNDSLIGAVGTTLASTLEALLGVWLLTRNNQPAVTLHTLRGYLRLITLGGGVACIIGALALLLELAGFIVTDGYINTMLRWWMGDALGIMLVTPFILAWWEGQYEHIKATQLVEGLLLTGITFIAGQIVFLDWFHEILGDTPKAYMMFFCVTWMALRMGVRGVTFVILMIAIQVIVGVYRKVGYFADDIALGNFHSWLYMLILSVVGMTVAISVNETKRTSELLQLKDSALNAAANGVVITDTDGRIEWANQAFSKLTGISSSEFADLNLKELVKSGNADYQSMWAILLSNKIWRGDIVNSHKDGSRYDVEMAITPLTDEQGEISHFVAVSQDVTERKQLEAAREEALTRLQKIASQLPGVVFQFCLRADGSSYFPYISDAIRDIYRLSPEDVLEDASKVYAIHHPDDIDNIAYCVEKAVLDLSPWRCEYRVKFDDGTVTWLFGNALLQRQADGSTLWHGFITDITERKHREKQDKDHLDELAHVTRLGLMGEMASGIAHEVNQPLTAISTYTQVSLSLINAENPDLAKLTEILSKTQQQALRAGQIVNRMKAFVKAQAKHRSTADVNSLINEAVVLCVAELKQNGINLIFELEDNLPPVYVDHIQIEQVIINLIRNSVDALQNLPEKQQRHLTIQSQLMPNNAIRVRVKDNGPGLDQDQQQKISTPFYTTKAEGTGMGLSISRSLIEAHGGTLHFNSQLGKGATFYFTLPIQRESDGR